MTNRPTDPPAEQPLMPSAEFMALTGVSEQSLRSYESKGIINPVARTGHDYYRLYSVDQVAVIGLVDALRHDGMSLPDIAQIVESGDADLLERTRVQCAAEIRAVRRRLKAATNLKRAYDDFRAVQGKKMPYVRYIPARWLALLPLEGDTPELPEPRERIAAFDKLQQVVNVVGWSKGLSYGTLASMDAASERATRYVYMELASPPMPLITGSLIVDGGCYSGVCPRSMRLPCYGSRCEICARFGAYPTEEQTEAWGLKRVHRTPHADGTVLVSELDEPYPNGAWASFTQDALADEPPESLFGAPRSDGPKHSGPKHRRMNPTTLPRKMPQIVRLPLGVTACELPAGMYLCRQFTAPPDPSFADAQRQALSTMMAQIDLLEHMNGRTLDNASLVEAIKVEERMHRSGPGPFVEPFAMPRAIGDPTLAGAFRSVSRDALRQMKLPVHAALWPEDGFCLMEAMEPLPASNNELTREYQVLVQCSPELMAGLH